MANKIIQLLRDNIVFIKFGISGTIALISDLFFLFLFHNFFKITLIISVYMAYTISFMVSFFFQKFWTFQNNEKDQVHKQFLMYIIVGVIALNLNTYLVHLLVFKFEVFYLFAQLGVAISIGIVNFLVYRFIIFREKKYWKKDIKNILIATGIFPPDHGGPASYVNILKKELPKNGYKLRIVTYSDLVPKACRKEKHKDYILYKISRKQKLWKRYFRYFYKIWRHLTWADLIYIQGPISEGVPASIACFLRRKKYILKVVGDYAWEQGTSRFGVTDTLDNFQKKVYSFEVELMRFLERQVAKKAIRVVTPSKYLAGVMIEWGVHPEKIRVIYNTVNKTTVDYNKKKLKVKLGIKNDIILSMGRLVPWKGFEFLIEAVPDILKINSNYKLIIIGDGPLRGSLETKVKELGLQKSVEIMKGMPQKYFWKYLAISEMLVLNTRYEGLSHVIIEAMKFKIPVCTTNVCGNLELIEDDKTGILFDYNDKEAMLGAIKRFYNNPEVAYKIVLEAANKVHKIFSKKRMIKDLEKLIDKVISEKK